MGKGELTRAAILDAALAQASEQGFESITIGELAARIGMSKSGLFAHFGSREELQIAAMELAAMRFAENVFLPALTSPRGVPRLRALFDNWLAWTGRAGMPHGCPIHAAGLEYDDRPGPVRDAVLWHYQRLERELGRAVELAIEQGHLRAGLAVPQFVFELLGVIFSYYHAKGMMRLPQAAALARGAFERLIADAAPATAGAPATPTT